MAGFWKILFGTADAASSEAAPEGVLRAAGPQVFRRTRTLSQSDSATGTEIFRSGVGLSEISVEEAERAAQDAARTNLEKARHAGPPTTTAYAYAVDRRREPLFEALASAASIPVAQITVNTYGALVLNAGRALFVDVDNPGEGSTSVDDDRAGRDLAALVRERPDLSFRVYQTKGGWRYLCTNTAFEPRNTETQRLLERLGADPKYRLLCSVQNCFRARLTPKPWRAGYDAFTARSDGIYQRKDLDRYLAGTNGFATTRFLSTVGGGETLPELQVIVDYHDRWTKAHTQQPLA